LVAVIERSGRRKHQARVGRVEEVLIEGPSKKDGSLLTGRTRQNKLVHISGSDGMRAGSYATVAVTGAAAHHLVGELVEVVARPRHRSLIPVAAV
jgi:tRNA-2-methylthio-N6-dimethylallyladenosine synthase